MGVIKKKNVSKATVEMETCGMFGMRAIKLYQNRMHFYLQLLIEFREKV